MEISSTGDGLSVIIQCEYTLLHNWMAMASCYSINKSLPDAEVVLACKRGIPHNILFEWTNKFNIRYCAVQKHVSIEQENRLIFGPHVMAIREYRPPVGPVDAKSDEDATFVSYANGCGKFVLSSWIDSIGIDDIEVPFVHASERFWTEDVSVNEMKVLNLWERLGQFYL